MTSRRATDVPVHPEVFRGTAYGTDAARLIGSRCGHCAEVFFPVRVACPRCHSAEFMVREELSAKGQIHALTHVARPAAQYEEAYVLALVDLDGGPRILAQVKGAPDRVRIGDSVELIVEPLFNTQAGQRVWGYRFAPVAGS